MIKYIIRIIVTCLILLSLVNAIYPLYFWWNNDTLTTVKIFKEFWELYILSVGSMILTYIVLETTKKERRK